MDLFDSTTWAGGMADLMVQPEFLYNGGGLLTSSVDDVSWSYTGPPEAELDVNLVFGSVFTAEFVGSLSESRWIVSDGSYQVVLEHTGGLYYFDGSEIVMPGPDEAEFVFRLISDGSAINLYVAQDFPVTTGLVLVASVPELPDIATVAAGMQFVGEVGTLTRIRADSQPVIPKRPPVAAIEGPAGPYLVKQSLGFAADESYDPDGYTLSYLWEIDGPVAVNTPGTSYASARLAPATFTAVTPGADGNGISFVFTAPSGSAVSVDYNTSDRIFTVTPGIGSGDTWQALLDYFQLNLLDTIVGIVVDSGAEGDSLPVSGGVMLQGGADSTNVRLVFAPPVVGQYIVKLTVFIIDGSGVYISSTPVYRVLDVQANTLLADAVPDGFRFWDLVPESFYRMFSNPQMLEVYWSGLIQMYGTVLHDVWTEDQQMNLQTIGDRIARRWLPYPTRLLFSREITQASNGLTQYGTVQSGGSIYLNYEGAHDGPAGALELSDSAVDFVAMNAVVGVKVFNLTDGSSATASSVAQHVIAGSLFGGAVNQWNPGDAYRVELRFPTGFRVIYVEERGSLHEVLRAPSGVAVLSPTVDDRDTVSVGIYGRVDYDSGTGDYVFFPSYGTVAFQPTDIAAGRAFITIGDITYAVTSESTTPTGEVGYILAGQPPIGRDYTWEAFLSQYDRVTIRVLSHVEYANIARINDVLETEEGAEFTVYGTVNNLLAFDATELGTTKRLRLRSALPIYEDLERIPKLKTVIAWNEVRVANGRRGEFSDYNVGQIWTEFTAPNIPTLDRLEQYQLEVGGVRHTLDLTTDPTKLLIRDRLTAQPGIEWQLYRQLSYIEYADYEISDGVIEFVEEHDFPPLLWAEISWFDNTERVKSSFGDIAGITPADVEGFQGGYSDAVRAIFYGLMTDSFTENVANAVALLVGVPVAFEEGVITAIDLDFTVDTSRIEVSGDTVRTYLFPRGVELAINPDTGAVYAVGDTVNRFARMTEGVRVLDWVNAPVRFAALIASGAMHPLQERHYFEVHVDANNFQSFDWAVQGAIISRLHPTHKWHQLLADVMIEDTLSLTDYCEWQTTIAIVEDMHTDTTQVNQGQYATMANSYNGAGQSQLHAVPVNAFDEYGRPEIPEYPRAQTYPITVKGVDLEYVGNVTDVLIDVLNGIKSVVDAAAIPGVTTTLTGNTLIVDWGSGSATVNENIMNWWHTEYQFGVEEGDPLSGPHGVAGRLELSGWEDFVEPWLHWYFKAGDVPRADMGLVADSVDENDIPDDERGLFFWADVPLRTSYTIDGGGVVRADHGGDLLHGWFAVYPYAGFVWGQTPRRVHRPYADQHVVVEKAFSDGVYIDPPHEATSPHYSFSLMDGSPTSMELQDGAGVVASGPVPPEEERNAVFERLTQAQRFRFNGDDGFVRQLFVQPWFRNTPIPSVESHDLGALSDGDTFTVYGRYFNLELRVFFGDIEVVPVTVNRTALASHSGTASGGTASTVTLDAGASPADHFYDHWELSIVTGTGSGQTRVLIDYDGTSKQASVTVDWDTAPDATSQFELTRYASPNSVSGVVPAAPAGTVVDVILKARGKQRTLVQAYTHTS